MTTAVRRAKPRPQLNWVVSDDGKDAHERAKALLYSYLTPGQRRDLERTGAFSVTVRGGNVYRIHADALNRPRRQHVVYDGLGRAITYTTAPGGYAAVAGHCVVPDHTLPVADQALTLLVALRANERKFRKVANTHLVYE